MINYTYDADLVAELREQFDNTSEGERLFFHKLWEMQIIPFDVREAIADSVTQFGFLGNGELIGRHARVGAVPIVSTSDGDYDFSNSVGRVVGDCNGRIVVNFANLYFGWLEPGQYELTHHFIEGTYTLQ